MERSRGIYHAAWNDCEDSEWLLAAGATGTIAQTYLKIMNKFCEQFGLTPSARSRIVADTAEDKESDEMELLLIKGGGR